MHVVCGTVSGYGGIFVGGRVEVQVWVYVLLVCMWYCSSGGSILQLRGRRGVYCQWTGAVPGVVPKAGTSGEPSFVVFCVPVFFFMLEVKVSL